MLTDAEGRPVSLSVFKGNTGEPKRLVPEVRKVRERFGIERLAVVGDRGMISKAQIDDLSKLAGVHWITALRTEAIRSLVEGGALELGMFDEGNLFEIMHPSYPNQRLVACRNPELARHRAEKRQELLVAEAALDGLYVTRTSLPADVLGTEDTVRSYKRLTQVERAFRTMKWMDLKVRPIGHHLEERVRAHLFLCMLAYYVQWHMMEAWRPLLFADEDRTARQTRAPVAPAERSSQALRKARTRRLEDGTVFHSFKSLLRHMRTIVRSTCRLKDDSKGLPPFEIDTRPDPKQQQA